jgi:membrane protein required for colicin V production
MTALDWVIIGIVALSTLFAFWRGLVRVVVSLATWIIAFVAGLRYSDQVAPLLPDFGGSPPARHLAAFALIVLAILIVGAIFGWMLSKLVRAVGLGFLDRALGAVFGVARGLLIAVILVLLAGLTDLPRRVWWQNSMLSGPLSVAAMSLRPWLPNGWAERLDYGGGERRPAKAVQAGKAGA